MGDTPYRVVLKPDSTPLAEADDVRLFDIHLDTDLNWSSLDRAAAMKLRKTEQIDPYALRHHWDIHCIYERDLDPVEKLQRALLATKYDPDHWRGDPQPLRLMINVRSNVLKPVTLGIQPPTADAYDDWKTELANTHPDIVAREERYLNQALLQTVADLNDDLPELLFTHPPTAHEAIISTALNNPETILDNYALDF